MRPESAALCLTIMHNTTAKTAKEVHVRRVNAWPALIKFFQRSPAPAAPMGRRTKGGRRFLNVLLDACQLPARMALTFSAILREASTDASSKATFERITHK